MGAITISATSRCMDAIWKRAGHPEDIAPWNTLLLSSSWAHPRGSKGKRPSSLYQSTEDRKSTRLNSSHANISYAVFCLKKKKNKLPVLSPISTASSSLFSLVRSPPSPFLHLPLTPLIYTLTSITSSHLSFLPTHTSLFH